MVLSAVYSYYEEKRQTLDPSILTHFVDCWSSDNTCKNIFDNDWKIKQQSPPTFRFSHIIRSWTTCLYFAVEIHQLKLSCSNCKRMLKTWRTVYWSSPNGWWWCFGIWFTNHGFPWCLHACDQLWQYLCKSRKALVILNEVWCDTSDWEVKFEQIIHYCSQTCVHMFLVVAAPKSTCPYIR